MAQQALRILLYVTCVTFAFAGWGAAPVDESLKPDESFISNFPTTNTVVVNAGEDFNVKVWTCSGYCRVLIAGQPLGPISIFRSRTMVVADPNTVFTAPSQNAFVYIGGGLSEVVVQGLNIRGPTSGAGTYQVGIEVSGSGTSKVAILDNKIHDFDVGAGNGHAIIVRGTGAGNGGAIKHVTIRGNNVYSMKTGGSESIVVNGNVARWRIANNDVWGVNNIAIDAIGGEGASAPSTTAGRILPGTWDYARDGWIEDNYVGNMNTNGNPAYAGDPFPDAAAIYVDGASRVVVKNNVVEDAEVGYEIGAENCMSTADITFVGNSAKRSERFDMKIGGYAAGGFLADTSINCDPLSTQDSNEGHGYVKRVTETGSTFLSPTKVVLEKRITETEFAHPSVPEQNTANNGFASGDDNAIRRI